MRRAYIARAGYTVATALASGALAQAWANQDASDDDDLVTTVRLSGAVLDREAVANALETQLRSKLHARLSAAFGKAGA